MPCRRFDLADIARYRKRSLTTQFQEMDWACVERLLLEEGMFIWFEHAGEVGRSDLGRHRLVIANLSGLVGLRCVPYSTTLNVATTVSYGTTIRYHTLQRQ